MNPQTRDRIFIPGETRLMKVLVRDGAIVDGHRAYPVAWNDAQRRWIVVAATEGVGFVWGRIYLVVEENHHPYVVKEVSCVPHEKGWKLTEAIIDDGAGHEDPY